MKITFFSNYLNHHQIPFCNEMYKLLGDNYHFVSTEEMEQERIELGWGLNEQYPYEIRSYENESKYNYCLELGLDSDVVIIGSAPNIFIKERLKQNKLTFRYSERFFKKGIWRLIDPRAIFAMLNNHTRYRNKKIYMLCASAYTARDASIFGAYPDKTYKWGYFTEVKKYELKNLFTNKKNKIIKFLWCGRFINLKHPEKAVLVMKDLKEKGYNCTLDFIGDGPIIDKIKFKVSNLNLNDRISFKGSMPPDKVREYMEKAEIFLFTSDRQEGWGAVLNEAMNSGCAVVASQAIGSVPFLLKDGKNGFIYKDNDINDLFQKVELLVKNNKLREKLGRNALRTIEEMWNPHIAVERFLQLCEFVLKDSLFYVKEGPCSKA